MSYNIKSLPEMNTAGKITVVTVVSCVVIFAVVFLLNVGQKEIQKAVAQTATTTLTVLNTPPDWTAPNTVAYEFIESSTSTPTNSGDAVTWVGTASDSNSAPYFMIVCGSDVAPVANAAASFLVLGTEPPNCAPGVVEWGVSASTTSGTQATVSTTTTEASPFSERERWYAWVCDDDPVNPRCNTATSTGFSATNTSPFHVNRRPVLTDFYNDGPVDPGGTLVFHSTSTDPDVIGGADEIQLVICNANDYSTTTNECGVGGTIATTTIPLPTDDADATTTIASVRRDQAYDAYGFLVDEHGHEASGGDHGANVQFIVNNVAPTLTAALIEIESGGNIVLTEEGGETTGFTLDFVTVDNNSCDAVGGGLGDEVVNYGVSLFPTGASSTCAVGTGPHNVNNCYASDYQPWNLVCTASTTTCTSDTDPTMEWNCTFPLWFTADPTDAGTPRASEYWVAGVFAVDDDNATGTAATSTANSELQQLQGIALDSTSDSIPYGPLEPGTDTGATNASTTILATGNVALDQNLSGASMCTTFTASVTCPNSATSTVPAREQEYASTTFAYGAGVDLSSTTATELELNVPKSTSTSSPSQGITYWGISVPGTITLAGSYTGLNTFGAVTAELADW